MNDPGTVTAAVVATLRAALGTSVRSIEAHGGVFDDAELKRFGAAPPAVRVSLAGIGTTRRYATGALVVPLHFAAVCLAKDVALAGVAKVDRRTAVQALATAVLLAIDNQMFGLDGVFAPTHLRGQNQYTGREDELGVALWQVLWTSDVLMGEAVDDSLAALAQLYVNEVLFAGPGAAPGADPLRDPPTEIVPAAPPPGGAP